MKQKSRPTSCYRAEGIGALVERIQTVADVDEVMGLAYQTLGADQIDNLVYQLKTLKPELTKAIDKYAIEACA
jgi:hypothetical protein